MPPTHTCSSLVPFKYKLLSLGSIKPIGWMRQQLQLSADGLAGHLIDFYRYVHNSTWLGGTEEYSTLNEAAPYWYNGIVPLAYVLDDERLKSQANQFLDYILTTQAPDGWLGPEKTKETRGIWARCLLLMGMEQHANADPSRKKQIVASMFRFVKRVNVMLKDNFSGYIPGEGDRFDTGGFGLARPHELSMTLQWLYEQVDNPGTRAIIWETMELMWQGAEVAGREWTKFFVPGAFPTEAVGEASSNFEHGVNAAQGLRYMAQLHRMRPSEEFVQQAHDAVEMLFKFHGTVAGSFTSDEYLGGLEPQRGAEVCATVELMFSLSYLYRLFGDEGYADKVEMAAFNAFPAGISEDWWSHQYATQTNQPWARRLDGQPFHDCTPYTNVFGLEPDYPCCLVNHHQAYPKLVASAFVRSGINSIAHIFLIPSELSLPINDGQTHITCDTCYPFDLSLNYHITTTAPFTFHIRIAGWTKTVTHTTAHGGSRDFSRSFTDTSNSLYAVPISPGSTDFTITLEANIRTAYGLNNTVSLYYGALLYALDIKSECTSHPPTTWETENEQLFPCQADVPIQARDHSLTPAEGTIWAIAIDPEQVVLRSNPDREGGPPLLQMSVAAVEINWPIKQGTPAPPPKEDEMVLKGKPFIARFVPFAQAKLRMAVLPAVKLPKIL